MIRIMTVDDSPVVLRSLALMISAAKDLELVGQATNGAEAVEMLLTVEPDVILMDFNMPGIDGLTAIRIIHRACPQIRFILLSAYVDEVLHKAALEASVFACLPKYSKSAEIIAAIRTAANEGDIGDHNYYSCRDGHHLAG